jgi:hypothetical protein
MTEQEIKIQEALYKIRSKEKPIQAYFRRGEGNTREYLEDLIYDAQEMTRLEFEEQVDNGVFTEEEAESIGEALAAMAEIKKSEADNNVLIAIYPEFKLNQLIINSVAIELNDTK